MRILAFALLVTLTYATPRPCNTGRELYYSYVSEALQGIPGTSPFQPGVRMEMNLRVRTLDGSNVMELKVTDCSSFAIPTMTVQPSTKLCEALKMYPLLFERKNGQIYALHPHEEEPDYILNVKRGILSAGQATTKGWDDIETVEEVDVLGDCWTDVREYHTGSETYVLKSRDTTKCQRCTYLNRPSLIFTPTIDQEAKFAVGRMTAEYKFLNDEDYFTYANVTQYEELAPLSKEAGRITSTLRQTLVLLKTADLECEQKFTTSGRLFDLRFDCQAKFPDRDTVSRYEKARTIIESLPDVQPHAVPLVFMKVIDYMRQLNRDELLNLRNEYYKPEAQEKMKKYQRDIKEMKFLFQKNIHLKHEFFLDALMFVQTDPAVEMIVELTKDFQLIKSRRLELTLSLAATHLEYVDPCNLLLYTTKLVTNNRENETMILVLGTVLGRVYHSEMDKCRLEVKKATDLLLNTMRESIAELPVEFDLSDLQNKTYRKPYKLAIHAIKALKNARIPTAITELKKAVTNMKLLVEGRIQALYALKETSIRAPELVRWYAFDLYMNTSEDEELRIAAFNTFIHTINSRYTVPRDLMMKFRNSMLTEKSENIKSYVCSYAQSLIHARDTSLRKRREAVYYLWKSADVFPICESADMSYSQSKSIRGYASLADLPMTRPLPRDVMGAGVTITSVYKDSSYIPRASSMKVKASMFGYEFDVFETGFRASGIEELIRHVFGPTGYILRGTRKSNISGLARHDDFDYDRPRHNVSAAGYLKFLGQELLWEQIEEDEIMEHLYNDADITKLRSLITEAMFEKLTYSSFISKSMEFIQHWRKGYIYDYLNKGEVSLWNETFNFTKAASLLDIKTVIPTILGMPLYLDSKATGYLQLDAGSIVTYKTEHPIYDSLPTWIQKLFGYEEEKMVNIYGEITPKFSVAMDVEFVLDAYDYQPKLGFFANATSNFTQRIEAKAFTNYTTSIEILETPHELWLLNSSYTPFAEVDGQWYILGVETRNNTQIYEPIGADFVGIDVFSNISYPNTSMLPMAPLFPLSGPANFTVILMNFNQTVRKLNFTVWNETEMSWASGQINTSLTGVGSNKWINSSLWWNDSSLGWMLGFDKLMEFAALGSDKWTSMFNWSLSSLPVNASSSFNITSEVFYPSAFEGKLSINTTFSNLTGISKFNRTYFYATAMHRRYNDTMSALIRLPEFEIFTNGSLKQKKFWKLFAKGYVEGSQEHFVFVNGTIDGLKVNATIESSLFRIPEMRFLNLDKIYGSVNLSFPIFNPVCQVFKNHFITFDGLKYTYNLSPSCEYVLARHRHLNDTFAITIHDTVVKVYINGNVYELTPDSTQLKVDGVWKSLPYTLQHVVDVRTVTHGTQRYVYFNAFAGLDVYYNRGDFVISIDRLYSNQVAGLCGNANSTGTYDDEMRTPSWKLAPSLEAFTQSWIVPKSQCTKEPALVRTPVTITPTVMPDTLQFCTKLFNEVLADGYHVVNITPFYDACVHEKSLGREVKPVVKAYVLAAKMETVSIYGCKYDLWSNWSECKGNEQFRTRTVSYSYLQNACLDQREARICDNEFDIHPECSILQKRWKHKFQDKVCRSEMKFPACSGNCETVYSSEREDVTVRCATSDMLTDDLLKNGEPKTLSLSRVVGCHKLE